MEFIQNSTIREVIMRVNPSLVDNDIQNNPFRWLPGGKLYYEPFYMRFLVGLMKHSNTPASKRNIMVGM